MRFRTVRNPLSHATCLIIHFVCVLDGRIAAHAGIKFVVDTGHVKQRVYNPRTGLDTLAVMPVSQAQAGQRTGRAGRESAGTCYRLYQELAFDGLPASTTPEILRVRTGLKLCIGTLHYPPI